jgi:hypothetical protein
MLGNGWPRPRRARAFGLLETAVVDGPFAEAKEVVGGYAVRAEIEAGSHRRAVRFMELHANTGRVRKARPKFPDLRAGGFRSTHHGEQRRLPS